MNDKKPTFSQLSTSIQQEIKDKYMEGYSSTYISTEYDLIRQSVEYVIRQKGWKEQRRLMRAELFQQFSDTKKSAFTSIYLDSTELLRIAIKDVLKEIKKDDMSVDAKLKMARDVSGVIRELDKIQRLDDGMPTEIREERPFAITDLQKRLREDPFYKEIEDAEFNEISDDASNGDS